MFFLFFVCADITKWTPLKETLWHLDWFLTFPGWDYLVYGFDGQTQTGQAAETWPYLWG